MKLATLTPALLICLLFSACGPLPASENRVDTAIVTSFIPTPADTLIAAAHPVEPLPAPLPPPPKDTVIPVPPPHHDTVATKPQVAKTADKKASPAPKPTAKQPKTPDPDQKLKELIQKKAAEDINPPEPEEKPQEKQE